MGGRHRGCYGEKRLENKRYMRRIGMAQRFRIARKRKRWTDYGGGGGLLVELWTDALPSARACRG